MLASHFFGTGPEKMELVVEENTKQWLAVFLRFEVACLCGADNEKNTEEDEKEMKKSC